MNMFAGAGDTSLLFLQNYHMSSHRLRRITTKTIQNQYNKNNTLVDHDRLRRHRNIAIEPEDPEVTTNFDMPESYFQCQDTKGTNHTADLFELQNRSTEAEWTYFSYHREKTLINKTKSAYLSVSRNKKLKDTMLNKKNQQMRKSWGTKPISLILQMKKTAVAKIDVTQAGSERLLTKLIREFISGEDFVKRVTRIRKANIRAHFSCDLFNV